jgi:hypothetical protein
VALEVKSKNSTIGSIFLWLSAPEEAFIGLTIKLEPEDEHDDSKQITRLNEQGLAAFVQKKAEIDTMRGAPISVPAPRGSGRRGLGR